MQRSLCINKGCVQCTECEIHSFAHSIFSKDMAHVGGWGSVMIMWKEAFESIGDSCCYRVRLALDWDCDSYCTDESLAQRSLAQRQQSGKQYRYYTQKEQNMHCINVKNKELKATTALADKLILQIKNWKDKSRREKVRGSPKLSLSFEFCENK